MSESISDWLEQHGWAINNDTQHFELAGDCEREGDRIPFSEIHGHTIGSFKEKAARKGWVLPKEIGVGKNPFQEEKRVSSLKEAEAFFVSPEYDALIQKAWDDMFSMSSLDMVKNNIKQPAKDENIQCTFKEKVTTPEDVETLRKWSIQPGEFALAQEFPVYRYTARELYKMTAAGLYKITAKGTEKISEDIPWAEEKDKKM